MYHKAINMFLPLQNDTRITYKLKVRNVHMYKYENGKGYLLISVR